MSIDAIMPRIAQVVRAISDDVAETVTDAAPVATSTAARAGDAARGVDVIASNNRTSMTRHGAGRGGFVAFETY